MAFHIIWSNTAVEDIKGIVQYIALDDPDAAAKLADHSVIHILRIWHAARGMPGIDGF